MTCIRLHPSGRVVEATTGATVLESIEKAG